MASTSSSGVQTQLFFNRDTPGLTNPSQSWRNTKLKNIKLNLHYNSTSGRYGFGDGPFLMQVNFDSPVTSSSMVGRAVGLLPELPRKESFETDICNQYLKDPCTLAKGMPNINSKRLKYVMNILILGGSRCPLSPGDNVNYIATMPFSGSYRRGLPVDLRMELYPATSTQSSCVTKDNLSNFGEPFICFIIQGYIL